MALLWTRINSVFLVVLILMTGAILAVLATRGETGPLDPQDPPGSSLPQVEPRRPIPPDSWNGTFPIQIDQPGSYFLTENLVVATNVNGINITTSQVHLDLNGFLVQGSGVGSSNGIFVSTSAATGIVIRNGTLSNWMGAAINTAAFSLRGTRISEVQVNGGWVGIQAPNATIEDCTVANVGAFGIVSNDGVVRRCTVTGSGIVGIDVNGNTLVEDNLVFGNGTNAAQPNRSNMDVSGQLNYIRDNVVLTPEGGVPTFFIQGTNNHFLRNYYRCGTVVGAAGNFFPAAVDLVDTNYC